MKNKAYFIKRLAHLKGLDIDSEEVKLWSEKKILELLNQIKDEKDKKPKADSDEDDDFSLVSRFMKT
jgi:hypothetical protein